MGGIAPVVAVIAQVAYTVAIVVFYVLWARVVLDFVRQVRRDWKPRGFLLGVSVVILALTDPILRVARRVVRPVRIGGASLDLAMLAVMVLLLVAMVVLGSLY